VILAGSSPDGRPGSSSAAERRISSTCCHRCRFMCLALVYAGQRAAGLRWSKAVGVAFATAALGVSPSTIRCSPPSRISPPRGSAASCSGSNTAPYLIPWPRNDAVRSSESIKYATADDVKRRRATPHHSASPPAVPQVRESPEGMVLDLGAPSTPGFFGASQRRVAGVGSRRATLRIILGWKSPRRPGENLESP
jgi:hypothetical protein